MTLAGKKVYPYGSINTNIDPQVSLDSTFNIGELEHSGVEYTRRTYCI
jgi:hypothetical protein